jgi:hypothetical protein
MAQIRNLLRVARLLASAFEIFSPVYSAIFLRREKGLVAKHPLPWIADGAIVRPGASFTFISSKVWCYFKRKVRAIESV